MIKSPRSSKKSKLKRSPNITSFLDESTESATSPKITMNVVVDVHNEDRKSQKSKTDENKSNVTVEILNEKRTEQSKRSDCSKSSLRGTKVFQKEDQLHLIDHETKSSQDSIKRLGENLTIQSLDLIEEFGESNRDPRMTKSLSEEKPRRRKQWNTTNVVNETENSKRPARKRWSKDTSVIQLPDTSDVSPMMDSYRPIPAPRSNIQQTIQQNSFFDNSAFVSENEEVIRIETDHKQKSTKIELRRMSSHTNIEDTQDIEQTKISDTSSNECSSKHSNKNSNDDRASNTKFTTTRSRKNSLFEELNSSPSLEKVTDIRSSSINSARSSMDEKSTLKATQDRLLRKKEQLLHGKENLLDDTISSSAKNLNSMVEIETETKIKRKKRKKKKEKKEGEIEKKETEETKYISVTIHRADILEANYMNTKRPMVKVHIVEASNGAYLRNMEIRENENTFLPPMITGTFNFKENRSMIPVWEEELIFEHNFNAIVKRGEEQVVILFEIIDLLSFAEASLSYDRFGKEECWNKIAWAFLKPVGMNNILHIDKKIRLQLYKPRRNLKKNGKHKCEVYTWWQSNYRDKYPSSLFVTITSVYPPKLEPVLYQQLALDDLSDIRSDSQKHSTRTSDSSISLPKWARLAAQSCKIPNEKMFETEISENGHFYITFSNNGKYLACVYTEECNYPIIIYEIETGKIHIRFLGHKHFVYSLHWSSCDNYLLSASADQTARIWDVQNKIIEHIEILPHPSYVYCAQYGPNNTVIVATGCYDQVIRIWANNKKSKKRELNQELEGHEGFINSMIFQKNGNLITADSVGIIILWAIDKSSRMSSRREWCILRKIKVKEIEGVIINTIALHPLESRLLVHSRNNDLRMIDLATGVVLQKYNHLNNQRIQSRACISPCGGLILCGGEDSVLNIWNLETGKHIGKYVNERNFKAVTCVDYHPYDHVLAFSTFGSPTPVKVLKFNKDASGNNIGLKFTEDISQTCHNELIMSISNYPLGSRNKSETSTRKKDLEESLRKGKSISSTHLANSSYDFQIKDNNYEQMKAKFRCLREAEKDFKSKSSNRLYYIIEKIDKILSNTRRSFEDLESGKCTEQIYKGDVSNWVLVNRKKERRQLKQTKFYKVNERISSSIESSISNNIIALDTFVDAKKYQTVSKERPTSAKESQIDRVVKQDLSKAFSDSAANSIRFYDDSLESVKKKNAEFNFITQCKEQNRLSDSSNSIVSTDRFDKTDILQTTQMEFSDKVETYMTEKTKHKKRDNSSIPVIKNACNEDIISNRSKQIDFSVSESDSSLPSNATFVIQNDASKSRRKKT